MSLRYEQHRALKMTREFLREILTGPRMPTKALRERASRCLHHFPFLRESGKPMWTHKLPAAVVPWGLAITRDGNVVATLTDGQVVCVGK